jgi:hypothetical protein
MELIYDRILIARSSSVIYLFKIVVDEETKEKNWKIYYTFDI